MKFYDKYIEILNKIKEIRGNIASVYRYLQQKYSITGSFKLKDLRKSLSLIPIKKCKVTSITFPNDGSGIIPADIIWYNGRSSINGIFNTNTWVKYADCSYWDTSKFTDLSNKFQYCSSLQYLDVRDWNTSNITKLYYTFHNCSSLKKIYGINNWDTSSVTNMQDTFYSCKSLESLDLRNWNTSKVTNMFETFGDCPKLVHLDVSTWNTSNVVNMGYLFSRYPGNSLDLSGWDASKVNNFKTTIYQCINLRTIIGNKTLEDVENGTVAMRGAKVNFPVIHSPLRFSSILALANGLADLTGANAQTLTISTASYNNMYNDDNTVPTKDVIAERQARIAAICAAKNWNFAH